MYELVRLQSDLEDRHATEMERKNFDIAELTDMVEELAARLKDLEVSRCSSLEGLLLKYQA